MLKQKGPPSLVPGRASIEESKIRIYNAREHAKSYWQRSDGKLMFGDMIWSDHSKQLSFSMPMLRAAETALLLWHRNYRFGILPEDEEIYPYLLITAFALNAQSRDRLELRLNRWCSQYIPDAISAHGMLKNSIYLPVKGFLANRTRCHTADMAAKLLNLRYSERQSLSIRTIGSVDVDKDQRKNIRREKDAKRKREKRRAKGVEPRAKYLEKVRKEDQPWTREGVSRATWYRRKKHRMRRGLSAIDTSLITNVDTPRLTEVRRKENRNHANT